MLLLDQDHPPPDVPLGGLFDKLSPLTRRLFGLNFKATPSRTRRCQLGLPDPTRG